MKRLDYTIRFNTPAFLGNAEQNAQWRTPPFKALLRQWWRVAKAKDFGYDHDRLRQKEMQLFGTASDSGSEKSHRSQVRLRLSDWDEGDLPEVRPGNTVAHNEVPGGQVGANLYLGYGPIGGQTRNAIAPETVAHTLTIQCRDEHVPEIQKSMQLAAWFGTLGSRSRNGWGAIHIDGPDIKGFSELNLANLTALIEPRPLARCLQNEWLHALGSDEAGLPFVWRLLKKNDEKRTLEAFPSWEEVMKELARIKIAVRTADYFGFRSGGKNGHPAPLPRHILAYPAGSKHKVDARGWGNDGRLANQVLFKVHRHQDGFAASIAHFPSCIPAHMADGLRLPDQGAVWKEVHRLLDNQKPGLSRLKGAQS